MCAVHIQSRRARNNYHHTFNSMEKLLQQEHASMDNEKAEAEGQKLQTTSKALYELKKQLKKKRNEKQLLL